jgi:putative MATE family efflux protein
VIFIGADAYFVGWLGYEALAGISLVFPFLLLMQRMAAGGMGGGVSSAIARALGGGRRDDANALVMHALIIALCMSAVFTVTLLLYGSPLYAGMGGKGQALEAASAYSSVIFCGAIFTWLANILANVVRGTGNMIVPASAIVAGEVVHLALAPALILGLGPFPRIGVTGAALGVVGSYAITAAILVLYIGAGRALVTFSGRGLRLKQRLFADILRVGALSSLNVVQQQAISIVIAALIGHFGTMALAGYGAALRLEMLQVPVVFGLGSAVIAMVGANVGAGQRQRAVRIAWIGAAIGAVISGGIGVLGAAFAPSWMSLFATEPQVQAVGVAYLRFVGPAYVMFGIGLVLFFASQGIGRVFWPFLAVTSRLAMVGIGGWFAVYGLKLDLTALFCRHRGLHRRVRTSHHRRVQVARGPLEMSAQGFHGPHAQSRR